MTKSWLILFNICVTYMAHAGEKKPIEASEQDPSWTSQIEFGYQKHTGNRDSESLNFNLLTKYTEGRHRTNGEWKFYRLYKDGDEDKRKSTYTLQSDYKIGSKMYLYTNFNGIDSKYSAYFKDYTLSAGYGYQLTHTEHLTVELELGPGYRYQKPNVDEIDSDDLVFAEKIKEPIVRGNVTVVWAITEDVRVESGMSAVSGQSNTLSVTDVGLVTKITQNVAMKLYYSRSYHSKVPRGLNKTDTTSSVNVILHF